MGIIKHAMKIVYILTFNHSVNINNNNNDVMFKCYININIKQILIQDRIIIYTIVMIILY